MGQAVFILGMDRSGTSTATRLISFLGLQTPREDDLIQARDTNPKGVWESRSLVAFNRHVLATIENDERFPLALEPGWEDDQRLEELGDAARSVVGAAFPASPWVWKDPLNCLTFSFWRKALPVQSAVVLMHRNPLEIAASALRAWGREKIYGLALWERYLRQSLAQIQGLPVRVARYDDVLSDPLAWCERTRDFLVDAGFAVKSLPEDEVLGFVDERLRHAEFTAADVVDDTDVSEAQRALFASLEELAGSHATFSAPDLPEETPTTDALLAERRNAFRIKAQLESMLERERASRWSARFRRSRYSAPVRYTYRGGRRLIARLGTARELRSATARGR